MDQEDTNIGEKLNKTFQTQVRSKTESRSP